MNKIILILHRDFSKGTGGAASLEDLSFFLHNQGYQIYHAQLVFNLDSIKFLFKSKAKILNVGGLFNYSLYNFNFKNIIRKFLSSLFKIFNYNEFNRFYKLLNDASIIIHTLPLNQSLLKELKIKSINSKHIYNHAGAVETFEKYWLKKIRFNNLKENSKYLFFFNHFDYILFQSIEQKTYCDTNYKQLSKKTIYLPPTCDEKEIINSKKNTSPFNICKKIIVNVGTVCERKNQRLSIEAFVELDNKMPNCELHFIGKIDDNYFKQLESLINLNNLEKKIFFHGYREDYLNYMYHSSLITLTSKSEGISRILREAIYLKVPVVATKISGTSEILENGCGILIDNFNKYSLCDAYFKILNEEKFALEIVNLAYNRYSKIYSNKSYLKNLKKILKKI
tara:strand:+ start:106 stop:1290 length:1185 start_codon:yes stop_codon:yes gene_type:complete